MSSYDSEGSLKSETGTEKTRGATSDRQGRTSKMFKNNRHVKLQLKEGEDCRRNSQIRNKTQMPSFRVVLRTK